MMPNLESAALAEWWDARPPALQDALRALQDQEKQPYVDPEATALAIRLGHALDRATPGSATLAAPESVPRLRLAFAFMPAAPRLRCLHWLALERTDLFRAVLTAPAAGALDESARALLNDPLADLRRQDLLRHLIPSPQHDAVDALLSAPQESPP